MASTVLSALVSLFVAPCFAPAFAGVRVVAPSGGDYTNVQAAVDASIDGDTILVRNGAYPGFTVQSKALAIVADGLAVSFTTTLRIRDLATPQTCVLAGLRTDIPASWIIPVENQSGLRIDNCAGAVRIERCNLRGADGSGSSAGGPGVYVRDSSGGMSFSGCTLTGGRAGGPFDEFSPGPQGGAGLRLVGSRAAVFDSQLAGGSGGNTIYGSAANGASGARVESGAGSSGLFACGSQFQGGRGGDSYEDVFTFNVFPGNGGDGIYLAAGTIAQLRDNVLLGGAPGIGIFCNPDVPPVPGAPSAGPGTYYILSAPKSTLDMPSLIRDQALIMITVHGTPGEFAFLDIGRGPAFHVVPSLGGVDLVASPGAARYWIVGEIPASGVLTGLVPIPDQGAGFTSSQWHVQLRTRDAAGVTRVGSPLVLTIVDSTY